MDSQDKNNQIIIYSTKNGETKIEVQMKDKPKLTILQSTKLI